MDHFGPEYLHFVITGKYSAMTADILDGGRFLTDALNRGMRPYIGKLSVPELIFPHQWSLSTQVHHGDLPSPDTSPSPVGSEGALSDFMQTENSQTISTIGKERVGRKRPKIDETEEDRKERQAAKNRQTAKAFRNKMDGMKAYAEMRVNNLKIWVRGLMEIVISQKRLAGGTTPHRAVRRTCSAPAGSLSATD